MCIMGKGRGFLGLKSGFLKDVLSAYRVASLAVFAHSLDVCAVGVVDSRTTPSMSGCLPVQK